MATSLRRCTRALASLAVASAASATATLAAGVAAFPRTHFATRLELPLAGQAQPGSYNLVMIAEDGHDVTAVTAGICAGIERSFNATTYAPQCSERIAEYAREARGLRMQHEERFAAAVNALEEKLGNTGHMAWEYADNVYARPYRARVLSSLLRALTTDAPAAPRTVCETGFGAGHSALLFLTALPPGSRVHTFDHGLSKFTIPAHDVLDEAHPNALLLYLGDSAVTVHQLPDYFPEARCDFVHLDGSKTAETVAADGAAMARLAAPRAIVALQGAGRGTPARAAWAALVANGTLTWEGTAYESPAAPDTSDAIVYGRYTAAAA